MRSNVMNPSRIKILLVEDNEDDIVLLDINMPKMNGFEFLEEIKKDPQLRHLPVSMLTTSNWEQDVLRSFQQGACSYVKKSADLSEFKKSIDRFAQYWTSVSNLPVGRS